MTDLLIRRKINDFEKAILLAKAVAVDCDTALRNLQETFPEDYDHEHMNRLNKASEECENAVFSAFQATSFMLGALSNLHSILGEKYDV